MLEYRKQWVGEKLDVVMNDIINTPVQVEPIVDNVEFELEEQPTE